MTEENKRKIMFDNRREIVRRLSRVESDILEDKKREESREAKIGEINEGREKEELGESVSKPNSPKFEREESEETERVEMESVDLGQRESEKEEEGENSSRSDLIVIREHKSEEGTEEKNEEGERRENEEELKKQVEEGKKEKGFIGLKVWYSDNLKGQRWWKKCWSIFVFTVCLPYLLTIPLVEEDKFTRTQTSVSFLFSPALSILVFALISTPAGLIPLWALMLILGVPLAAIVFFLLPREDALPRWEIVLSIWAFLVSLGWMYLIANELVEMLNTLGQFMSISNLILGATVLAWFQISHFFCFISKSTFFEKRGNSIGDLVADVTMARGGYASMAISACIGGPFFNLVFGSGLGLMYGTIKNYPSPYIAGEGITHEILAASLFLGVGLFSTLVVVWKARFRIPRGYSIYLFVLYLVFSVFLILFAVKVFN